jgi:hypothetical protein
MAQRPLLKADRWVALLGCASRSAAILYGSVLHARLTPRLWLAWSGLDGVRQDEGRHGAVGEVDAVRGDMAAL